MKIRKGLLIVVKDAQGGQVVGLDSNYAQTLIDNHGKGNSYSCELGHGLTITFTTYTDHRRLFTIWKHKILERIYQRQLQKALKRTQRMQSSIPTATIDSTSKSLISSLPPNQVETPSLITSNDVAGLPDGSTGPTALFRCWSCGKNWQDRQTAAMQRAQWQAGEPVDYVQQCKFCET